MKYEYDKDFIKSDLTLSQIEELLIEFDAAPERHGEIIVSRTVCHGGNTHKLYYYSNTTLFRCYTDCAESFDVFELVRKVMSREHPKGGENSDWTLPEAIDYVAKKFGYSPKQDFDEELNLDIIEDLKLFEKYDRIKNIDTKTQEVELKEYDGTFLTYLPHPTIQPWIDEGISKEVMDAAGICYDPKNQGIVIPHYDINNRLIGIRERTLIQEQVELYGKYMPAKIGQIRYTHPLSFNLYNLNHSKNNIKQMKKAFVFESEKSCLLYRTYFGEENDLSVAVCGSSFIAYQAWLLMNQGVKEIIIALDKQYQTPGDDEHKKLIKNLKNIHKKYGQYITISYLFDKRKLLEYKDSPIDKEKEVFLELYKNRVNLY